jgi:hypothetical protein
MKNPGLSIILLLMNKIILGLTMAAACSLVASAAEPLHPHMDDAWNRLTGKLLHPKTEMLYDAIAPENGTGNPLDRNLPTPEEMAAQFPNPNGWSTCMEDGVLHSVPMLLAALAKVRATGDTDGSTSEVARKLFRGLRRCVEIPGTGYLARNICPFDMKSFYWNCSRDQYTLWVYGMWRYSRSPLATEADKADVRRLMTMVARFHEKCVVPENLYNSVRHDGKVGMVCRMWVANPFKEPSVSKSNGGSVDGLCAHEALRLPEIYAATWNLTGDAHWRDLYFAMAEGGLHIAELPLRENLAGFCSLQMQLSQRILFEIDPDPVRKTRYRKLLERGRGCAAFSFATTDRLYAERKGNLSVPAPDWRTYRFRYLSNKGWMDPGCPIAGFFYMLPEWPNDFAASYTCMREYGEGLLDQLLCPGVPPDAELVERFRANVRKMDFATHCSAGAVYPLLAYWWMQSPE